MYANTPYLDDTVLMVVLLGQRTTTWKLSVEAGVVMLAWNLSFPEMDAVGLGIYSLSGFLFCFLRQGLFMAVLQLSL